LLSGVERWTRGGWLAGGHVVRRSERSFERTREPAMKIRITHDFDTTEEAFFKLFFDTAGLNDMYRSYMGFPEFDVKQQEDDAKITRTITAVPKMEMPAAMAKLVGSNFRYVEQGTFDKKTKVFTWKTTPGIMADKIRNEGVMKVEVLGPNKVRRTAEIELEAKVFGLGGMIESTFEKTIKDGWEKASQYFREHLK
jgi:hypothetical protein